MLPAIRERSQSPQLEAAQIPVPNDAAVGYPLGCRSIFNGFLAKRYNKKRELGAHSEFHFQNESAKVRSKFGKSHLNGWNDWKQLGAIRIIEPEEVESFRQQHPEMEILQTRLVDTNKAPEEILRRTRP